MRWAGIALLAATLGLSGCTGKDGKSAGPSSPLTGPESLVATSGSPSRPPFDLAAFERTLRNQLTPPPLPAFTIPITPFRDAADQRVERQLAISPGLYEGIAVLDARCDRAGRAAGADSDVFVRDGDASYRFKAGRTTISTDSDGAGTFDDGQTRISLDSRGGGSYADGTLRITVKGDGSGTFDDGRRRISINRNGGGSYDAGASSLVVNQNGSGTYSDGTLRVTLDAAGSGTYDDGRTRVRVRAGRLSTASGDQAPLPAVVRVLIGRLPSFPPVPRLGVTPLPRAGRSCGTVIRLDTQVLFDFDRAEARPEGTVLLGRVATLLRALGFPNVEVNGHTDGRGSTAYNVDLSGRRAQSVAAVLARRGVPAATLATRGLGKQFPIRAEARPDGSDDPAGRQFNRRVELVLPDR